MRKLIIAIDGPAAAGKSTAAKNLAKRLGYLYLDSGALYRAIAWKLLQEKINPESQEEVEAAAQLIEIELRLKGEQTEIWVGGFDATPSLRLPEVTRVSSIASTYPGVRKKLLSIQRSIGSGGGVVMEGRDIGTVVFPDADLKFYIDASPEERARRRAADRGEGMNARARADLRRPGEHGVGHDHDPGAELHLGPDDRIGADLDPGGELGALVDDRRRMDRHGPARRQPATWASIAAKVASATSLPSTKASPSNRQTGGRRCAVLT